MDIPRARPAIHPRIACGCLVIIAFVIIMGVVFGIYGLMPDYSNGERVGVVNKFSIRGVFYKSNEGELLMVMPAGVSAAQQPEKFEFTVDPDDASTISKINAAMSTGKRVSLVYHQYLVAPIRYGTDYVVVDVKPTQ